MSSVARSDSARYSGWSGLSPLLNIIIRSDTKVCNLQVKAAFHRLFNNENELYTLFVCIYVLLAYMKTRNNSAHDQK